MLAALKHRGLWILNSALRKNYFKWCRSLGSATESPLEVIERPRLVEMKYGEKVNHIFTDHEFSSRISKLRNHMAKVDIGACVFTSYHNINYYSGLVYCSMGRNYGLIVTHDDCKTVTSAVDGGQPWRRGKADNLVYTDWYPDTFFHAIQTQLQDIGGKIGLEFDVLSVDNLSKWNTALPTAEKTDIAQPTMVMRTVKSPEEIEVIRNGARIADIGGFAGVEAIAEGVPEYEVVLQAKTAMVREIAKTYPQSDIMDTWAWMQTGINSDGGHNPATTKKIKNGEIMILNCFPMIQGYFAAMERNLFLNHVSDEHLYHWKLNCDVLRRGCELVKPGVRCCDVTEELNEMFREKNLLQYRTIGYGHSFGSISYYYGREAALEFREYVTTVLEPGMVISMEPMIVIPEGKPGAGGYREHDLLVVTEDGNENLTKFPLGPEHNIIQK